MQFPKTTSHISYSVAAEKHTCLPRRPVVNYVYFLHRCFDPSLRTNQETPSRRKATNQRLLTRISVRSKRWKWLSNLRVFGPAMLMQDVNIQWSWPLQSSKCISIQKGQLVIICQGDSAQHPFFCINFHQKKEVNNTSIHPTTTPSNRSPSEFQSSFCTTSSSSWTVSWAATCTWLIVIKWKAHALNLDSLYC